MSLNGGPAIELDNRDRPSLRKASYNQGDAVEISLRAVDLNDNCSDSMSADVSFPDLVARRQGRHNPQRAHRRHLLQLPVHGAR